MLFFQSCSMCCSDHSLSEFQLFVVSTVCNLIAKMCADLSHMFSQHCAVQLVVDLHCIARSYQRAMCTEPDSLFLVFHHVIAYVRHSCKEMIYGAVFDACYIFLSGLMVDRINHLSTRGRS